MSHDRTRSFHSDEGVYFDSEPGERVRVWSCTRDTICPHRTKREALECRRHVVRAHGTEKAHPIPKDQVGSAAFATRWPRALHR